MVMPIWLPSKVNVNGVWEKTLSLLYTIFQNDFVNENVFLGSKRVTYDDRILEGQYEEGFWHLITRKDLATGERLFDPPRAERLPWCAPTLNNSTDSEVLVWDYNEGSNGVRTYVWLRNWDYVIILRKQTKYNIASLITAYHVDGSSSRSKLQRKYAKRVN